MSMNIEIYLDNKFKVVASLKWLPFVGKDYQNQEDKILIVGESHYVPEGQHSDREIYEDEGWTRAFIRKDGPMLDENFPDGSKSPIIRNIELTLNIDPQDLNQKRKLWSSVVYYNFIQKLLDSRKNRPGKTDFELAWVPFFEMLEILKPKKILFCGLSATRYPNSFYKAAKARGYTDTWINATDKKVGRSKVREAFLFRPDYQAKILFIRHPSSYYSWKKWREVYLGVNWSTV